MTNAHKHHETVARQFTVVAEASRYTPSGLVPTNAMKLLCDDITKDRTWAMEVSSACYREHWDTGGLASDVPMQCEGWP